MKYNIISINSKRIGKHSPAKYKKSGNVISITTYARLQRQLFIFKLDKDHYIKAKDWFKCIEENILPSHDYKDYPLGVLQNLVQVHECRHTDTRADNYKSLLNTFSKLRDLINCNVKDINNVRWITLTYADNMQDTKKLMRDFDHFWRRLKEYCDNEYGIEPVYISAVEPQARGSWHIHCIAIFPYTAPYIPADEIWKMWSPKGFKKNQDFIRINALKKNGQPIDNLGAYLSAYLTDTYNENDHKREKYNRLQYYPTGMNYYRCSKGLKRPEIEYTSQIKAKKKAGSAKPTFSKNIAISTENFTNEFQYDYYKLNI